MTPIAGLKNKPCIYSILNKVNGKIYVGKTKCLYRRCHQYLGAFKNKSQGKINQYLLNSFEKYGIDNFEMLPIEFCDISKIDERELYWISELRTTEKSKGYNLRLDSSTGMITHRRTSEKISNNLKKQWAAGVRDSHSDKLKESWKNNPQRKIIQSELFTKYKTKYCYVIHLPDSSCLVLNYKGLKSMKLHTSVLSCFNRHSGNKHLCKGYSVERVAL